MYIYHVDATQRPLEILSLTHFNHHATDMNGATNDYIHDIFMVDSWFVSVPTEQSIRRDGNTFEGIVKTAHDIFQNDEV